MTVRDLTPEQIESIRIRFFAHEKPADIAGPLELTASQVSNLAYNRGWSAERASIDEKLTRDLPSLVCSRMADALVDYVTQHTEDWQTLRGHVLALLGAKWAELTEEAFDELKAKATVAINAGPLFEKAQKGQRLSLGLDKPETKASLKDENGSAEADDLSTLDPAELERRYQRKVRSTQQGNG